MLVGILKKLVGIMIGPVGILKNACRYFETVGIMNVGILNVGIMNATHIFQTFWTNILARQGQLRADTWGSRVRLDWDSDV